MDNVQDRQPRLDFVTVEPDVRENEGSIETLRVMDVEILQGVNKREESTTGRRKSSTTVPYVLR